MATYGKLENGRLIIAGNIIAGTGWSIVNPSADQLKEKGYKTVIYGTKPEEYDDETERIQETYKETAKQIKVNYELVPLTVQEHNQVIQSKIVAEEAKVTDRYLRSAPLGDEFARTKLQEIETAIAELRAKLQ